MAARSITAAVLALPENHVRFPDASFISSRSPLRCRILASDTKGGGASASRCAKALEAKNPAAGAGVALLCFLTIVPTVVSGGGGLTNFAAVTWDCGSEGDGRGQRVAARAAVAAHGHDVLVGLLRCHKEAIAMGYEQHKRSGSAAVATAAEDRDSMRAAARLAVTLFVDSLRSAIVGGGGGGSGGGGSGGGGVEDGIIVFAEALEEAAATCERDAQAEMCAGAGVTPTVGAVKKKKAAHVEAGVGAPLAAYMRSRLLPAWRAALALTAGVQLLTVPIKGGGAAAAAASAAAVAADVTNGAARQRNFLGGGEGGRGKGRGGGREVPVSTWASMLAAMGAPELKLAEVNTRTLNSDPEP